MLIKLLICIHNFSFLIGQKVTMLVLMCLLYIKIYSISLYQESKFNKYEAPIIIGMAVRHRS